MLGGFEYLREVISKWLTRRHCELEPHLSSALDHPRTQEWHYVEKHHTRDSIGEVAQRLIIIKVVAMSSYECMLFFKASSVDQHSNNNSNNAMNGSKSDATTITSLSDKIKALQVPSKVLSLKITFPANACYKAAPIYLPEETQRYIQDQLSSQLTNFFPSVSDAPTLSFISQEAILSICQMLQGKDVAKFCMTSKRNQEITSNNDQLWEILLHQDFNPKFTKSATKSWKLAYKDLFLQYLEQERMLRFDYGTPGHRFLLTPPSWSPDNDGEPLSPLWLPPLRLGMRANEDGDSYAGAFPPPGPTSTWRHPPSRSTLDTWF